MEENKATRREDLLEDEIDLVELFLVIWKRKTFIILFVLISTVSAAVYSLYQDDIYESKAVISLSSGAIDIYAFANKLVENQKFLSKIVEENRLYEKLFDDFEKIRNEDNFRENKDFFFYKAFRDIIRVEKDRGSSFVIISVRHKDRFFAKDAVDKLLNNISQFLKEEELKYIDVKIEKYSEHIANASDVALKDRLSGLVATLIQSKVMASAQ